MKFIIFIIIQKKYKFIFLLKENFKGKWINKKIMKLKVKYFNKYILPSIIFLKLIKYKLNFLIIHTYYFILIFLKILKKKYEVLLKFDKSYNK